MKTLIFSLFFATGIAQQARAQEVGRDVAGQYFSTGSRAPATVSDEDHFLAIQLGQFMESSAWEWGQHERAEKTGNYSIGFTYRIQKYTDKMDLNLRVVADEYNVVNEKPFKLSFMPLITFPEAASKFPLYFGGGLGAGVFFRQVKDESFLSLDYQLIMGARFFDIYENAGFFIETGLKNHLLVTSSGQFNGVFLSAGAVFTF